MIYFTQLIYLHPGGEQLFDRFEELVAPIIVRHNGRMLLRLRINADQLVSAPDLGQPNEVHIVEFASRNDFERYLQDGERKSYLPLKEDSVRATLLIEGRTI